MHAKRIPIRNLVTILSSCLLWSATAEEQPADAPHKSNLLGWAEGAFTVRTPTPARTNAHVVALDGLPHTSPIGVPKHAPLPHEFIIELPAPTTFESFAVPELGEFGPAKGKHVKTVVIEGSSESAGAGFSPLTTFQIEIEKKAPQEFAVAKPRPVRWLKVRLIDRYTPQQNPADGVLFSELMGYGTQEERVPPEEGFSGIWNLRRGYDVSRNLIELHQDGNQVSGCQVVGGQLGKISGTVDQGIARLITTTNQGGRNVSTPSIALITTEGEIHGVSSYHGGLRPFSGVPSEADTKTPCSEEPEPENAVATALAAGLTAVVYGIHFDVDSDVLRPDAKPALEQILAAMQAHPKIAVTIEGHTDSDGSDAHNLDLSQRRARAVVKWLTDHKTAPGRLQADGKGETKPIADNASAVGRALNRRVEVAPRTSS